MIKLRDILKEEKINIPLGNNNANMVIYEPNEIGEVQIIITDDRGKKISN